MRQPATTPKPTTFDSMLNRSLHALRDVNPGAVALFLILGAFAAGLVVSIQNGQSQQMPLPTKAIPVEVGTLQTGMSSYEFFVRTRNNGFDDIFVKNVADPKSEKANQKTVEDILRDMEEVRKISFPMEI